jgi:hypothetical protein
MKGNCMNFLKRLANSSHVAKRFRWPSAFTLRIYWYLIALIGIGTTFSAGLDVYRHAVSKGLAHPDLNALAVSFLNLVAWGLLGLIFLFIWGLYYRMGTEIAAGYRRFVAGAPGAWQSSCRGAAAVLNFLLSIPSLVGRFYCALGRAFLWLAGLPAWWGGLSGKQKVGVITSFGTLGVYATTIALFYPAARHISAASPSWMLLSDTPQIQTLFIDIFVGCIIGTFAVAVIAIVFSAIAHLFSKK